MVVTKIVDDKLNIDYKVDIKEKEKCIQTIKVASDKLKEINTQTKKENSVKNLLDRASKKSKEFNKNLSKKTSVKERVK